MHNLVYTRKLCSQKKFGSFAHGAILTIIPTTFSNTLSNWFNTHTVFCSTNLQVTKPTKTIQKLFNEQNDPVIMACCTHATLQVQVHMLHYKLNVNLIIFFPTEIDIIDFHFI